MSVWKEKHEFLDYYVLWLTSLLSTWSELMWISVFVDKTQIVFEVFIIGKRMYPISYKPLEKALVSLFQIS